MGRLLAAVLILGVTACSGLGTLPSAKPGKNQKLTEYRIGSDDNLQIFVWRNAELSTNVPVRPDGKITIPLIEDLPATGRTPTELARDIEKALASAGFDQEKIESIKSAIEQGNYPLDDRKIADSFIPLEKLL